jgi:hypothetical protein
MRPGEPEDDDVVSEFRKRERRQLLAVLPLMLAVVAAKLAHDHPGGTVFAQPAWSFYVLAIALVVGSVLFALLNWRCPACGRYLGHGPVQGACPRCRRRLR